MHFEHVEERGTFEQISFALLLIRALDKRWTGTLLIEPPSGHQQIIQIDRGLVCRVLVPDGYARLGTIVVDAGVVLDKELQKALDQGGLLGEALLAAKLIDEKTVQRALVLQLLKRLARMFGFPVSTAWTFSLDLGAFDDMPPGVRIDTLRVLWAGISAHGEMGNWLAASVKRIGESRFMVRRDVNLRRFGFTGDARLLVRIIRDERCNVAELFAREVTPDDVVRQIVYLLAITRYLDFSPVGNIESTPSTSPSRVDSVDEMSSISDEATVDEPTSSDAAPDSADRSEQPSLRVAKIRLRRVAVQRAKAAPDPPGSGEPTAPSSASGDEDTPSSGNSRERLLSEIQGRLARLESESPFTLLNIEPSALSGHDEDAITDLLWEAFEKASQRWNPDQCPNELKELREGMVKIHTAMGEAFALLVDAERRAEAIATLGQALTHSMLPKTMRSESNAPSQDRHPTPPSSGERALEATRSAHELHALALTALAQQRADDALRMVRAACESEPDNPDYLASSVWIRASMERPDLKVLLLDLDDLLRHEPEHVTARYYRGVLRRRLGSDSSAQVDFERVLELDPGHAGARNQLAEVTKRGSRA